MIDDSGLVRLENKLKRLERNDIALRTAAQATHQQMAARIFPNAGSKDENRRPLGTYTKSYLKTRAKKGWSNKKINLQLTGQMEGDWSLLVIKRGGKTVYASGFKNNANAQKAEWVEGTYKTIIFELTPQEEKLFFKVYNRKLNEALR